MPDQVYITVIVQDFFFALILLLSFIYLCLILFIRRFHHRNNMFILNICFTIISVSVFFVVYFTMLYFDVRRLYASYLCIVLLYAYNIATIAIPFSFVAFTIHRYCAILHHTKLFFKKKRWIVICIGSEWIAICFISLPFVLRGSSFCTNETWMRIYTFIMAVIVSTVVNTILNGLIFMHVRSSIRRVQPMMSNTNTNDDNNRQPKINRREISLLRQMAFMFFVFIIGWFPTYSIVIITQYIYLDPLVFRYSVLIGEASILAIIINLFIYNHDVKIYVVDKIRQLVR